MVCARLYYPCMLLTWRWVSHQFLSVPGVSTEVIYNWINSNHRDSPIWQRGFLTAGGAEKLKEFWDEEGSDQEPGVSKLGIIWKPYASNLMVYINMCISLFHELM